MAKWYLDEGLARFREQWLARHPGAVVYSIGDEHHSSTSEHSPEKEGPQPGQGAGEVDALDLMPGKGGVTMGDLRELRDDLMETRDPRLLYMIIDKQIVSSVVAPWAIRPYSGKTHGHLHVSVNDRFKANRAGWQLDGKGGDVPRSYTWRKLGGNLPELRVGDEDPQSKTGYIARVQLLLGVDSDGVYGPMTAAALARRMRSQTAYKPSSTNGGKLYEPEWRVLYGLWGTD